MREEGDMVDHEGVREEGDMVDHEGVREEGDKVDHEGGVREEVTWMSYIGC